MASGASHAASAFDRIATYDNIVPSNKYMSFLFHKNTKRAIKYVWIVVASLIILSMLFAYSGGQG